MARRARSASVGRLEGLRIGAESGCGSRDIVFSQGCRSAEPWHVALDDFRLQIGDALSDQRLRQVARGTNPVDRADELAVVG